MKNTKRVRLAVLVGVLTTVAGGALPHPGGLDAWGGHYDHRTGVYHYHRFRIPEAPATPPPDPYDPDKADYYERKYSLPRVPQVRSCSVCAGTGVQFDGELCGVCGGTGLVTW